MSRDELEEKVEELREIRGSQTELISVYIPADQDLNTVRRQMEDEKGTAENIKSKNTRKNVISALDSIGRYLKRYKKTPENGLAIFCGNVSESEGKSNIDLWAIEPPQPLNVRLYRCDKEFVLDPLEKQLEADEVYGLVVMDRKEATIGLLEGKHVKKLRHMTSGVPGKQRAGGQCLSPNTIVNEKEKGKIEIKDVEEGDSLLSLNFKYNGVNKKWGTDKGNVLIIRTNDQEIVSSLDHIFYIYSGGEIKEISADKLNEGDFLVNRFEEKLEIKSIEKKENNDKLIDLDVENRSFIANGILVHNSAQRFARKTETMAKKFFKRIADAMKEIFLKMDRLEGILVGGPVPTKEDFLKKSQLDTQIKELVIGKKDLGYTDESGLEELVRKSQDLLEKQEIIKEKQLLEDFFRRLGKGERATHKEEEVIKALKYGATEKILLSKKLDKAKRAELTRKAENISAEVELVSTDTEEGKQFWNMGGIGALLRFEV